MTGYILSIAGVVLLSALVAMIAPSGKMGEFLKGVTKLVTLFILLAPIGKLAAGDEFIFSVGKIETDEAYLAYCAQELSAQDWLPADRAHRIRRLLRIQRQNRYH